ncbi:MAG TPA: hypothetical protein VFA90_04155 [Terriglobales bacterium]|nr:hypothetical protein [Terriglobales bacterium]
MDVRRSIHAFVLLAYFGAGQLLWSQSGHSGYDPAPRQASHSRIGFLDFTLKRINPSEYDYGQAIATARDRLRRETIENSYFWSNLVALGLLGAMFFVVSYQHRRLTRATWNSAEVVAQYEHALERANAEIENRSRRNQDLANALTKLKEAVVSPASDRTDFVEATVRRELRKPQADTGPLAPGTPRNKSGNSAKNNACGIADVTAVPASQIGLFKSEVDLIMKINSLEQQLARSRDVESELRRQLNQSGRKIQLEQEKNRTVKGA